ncbi:MAG TPA: hypothetical protein PLU87_12755 [Sedimentisphaerales bacterium]|nr:hypothetical protein [Sedimentisphaerales bacterium]
MIDYGLLIDDRRFDERCASGTPDRPTVQVTLYVGALRAPSEIDVAMHFKAPYATTLACQINLDEGDRVTPRSAEAVHTLTVPGRKAAGVPA